MTSLNIFDVAGLGSVVVDHQMMLREYPAANSKVEANGEHVQIGGPVPTALVQLVRWGKSCTFIGCWATDHHGGMIYTDLKTQGVDITHSTRHPDGRSGMAQVWVDIESGSRTIACNRGSHEIKPREIPTTPILHLDGWSADAALMAAKQVKEAEGIVVLDTGSPKPGMDQLFPFVDIVICPSHFMERYFHDSNSVSGAQKLLDQGVRMVIHTHGEKGADVYLSERQFHQPAFDVDVVDTTGAGDIFSAGILYGTLEGWEEEQTVQFASAAAAFKCMRTGNRESLAELHEVLELL
jgi:sugar/nucleoside kinase (ribokinase family)